MCWQMGAPSFFIDFFITYAPGAYVTPAPWAASVWVFSAAGRGAGKLEHVAPWVEELVRGFFIGTTAELRGPCPVTPFGARQGRLLCWVAKIEFQNDSRGRGRHRAHGTGFVMCRGGGGSARFTKSPRKPLGKCRLDRHLLFN